MSLETQNHESESFVIPDRSLDMDLGLIVLAISIT